MKPTPMVSLFNRLSSDRATLLRSIQEFPENKDWGEAQAALYEIVLFTIATSYIRQEEEAIESARLQGWKDAEKEFKREIDKYQH